MPKKKYIIVLKKPARATPKNIRRVAKLKKKAYA